MLRCTPLPCQMCTPLVRHVPPASTCLLLPLPAVYSLSGVYSVSGFVRYSLVQFTVTVHCVARMHDNSLGGLCAKLPAHSVCASGLLQWRVYCSGLSIV